MVRCSFGFVIAGRPDVESALLLHSARRERSLENHRRLQLPVSVVERMGVYPVIKRRSLVIDIHLDGELCFYFLTVSFQLAPWLVTLDSAAFFCLSLEGKRRQVGQVFSKVTTATGISFHMNCVYNRQELLVPAEFERVVGEIGSNSHQRR